MERRGEGERTPGGEAMAAQMLMSAVLVVPGLAWTGLPPQVSWIWIAASTLMNIVTVTALLLRAYELGGFGVVYPVVRAVSVVLVVPLAALLVGERLGLEAIAGMSVWSRSRLGYSRRWRPAGSRLYVGGAGLDVFRGPVDGGLRPLRCARCPARGIAVVVWIRRLRGERGGHELAAAPRWDALAPAPVELDRRRPGGRRLGRLLSAHLLLGLEPRPESHPPRPFGTPARSFAILIAVAWLKEPFTRSRLFAVLLAAAAVPLLRLA